MRVRRIIVHEVKKEQHTTSASLHLRERPLPISELTNSFVTSMEDVYGKRVGKAYGIFESSQVSYPFQGLLAGYFANQSDSEFVAFSRKSAELLKKGLEGAHASTGGYLFCIHYRTDNGAERFLVAVLNETVRSALSPSTLDLVGSISLDVEHLNMAARVDIERWRKGKIDGGAYLSFTRGRKNVTQYFISFVGCADYQPSAVSTRNMVEAVDRFLETLGVSDEDRVAQKRALYESVRKESVASPSTVANIISPSDPDRFLQFLEDNEIEISSDFQPDRKELKFLIRVQYKSNRLNIDLDRRLITSGEVHYDEGRRRLIIEDADGHIRKAVFEDG